MAANGTTVWITGLSGAGKSTTTAALRTQLVEQGAPVFVIDGDDLRGGLSSDLGFSNADRDENVRRAGELAILAAKQGFVVLVALISPRRDARASVRARHEAAGIPFFEVFLSTPLEVCEARDPKALYRRARSGDNRLMTGIDDPYEAPTSPDLALNTDTCTPDEAAAAIRALL